MRRGHGSLLAAVLVLALVAVPLAEAQKGKPLRSLPERLPSEPDKGEPRKGSISGASRAGSADEMAWVALAGMVGLAGAMLALGLLAARRSRRKPKAKAPRKTYDAGRLRGRALHPRTIPEALRRLGEAGVGQVLEAAPTAAGARIMIERPRSHPCEEVVGFVSGLFESVWAADVRIEHDHCAGRAGTCRYDVSRADSPILSATASRAEAASTPGWSGGRRRSPPARSGGG